MANNQPFDPAAVAQSMVNAQYNPAIASLQQMLNSLGRQDKFNQQQIAGWYSQMQNLMNTQNAQQGQATQDQLAGVSSQLGNVAQLFGAQNAQQMQPALGNAAGMLATMGGSNQNYLQSMVPLLAAQAAQGTMNEQNAARAQRNNYSSQLQAQRGAKGAAYQAAYQQAVSNHTAELQNALALKQAKALLPYQVSTAKSNASIAATNAANAQAMADAKLAAQQAQIAHYRALTKQEQAQAQAALQSVHQAGILKPGSASYSRVQRLAVNSIYQTTGKGHKLIQDAQQAQKALAQEAVAQGLIGKNGKELVKGAVRMLNGILASTYRRTPAWQKYYLWNRKAGTFSKRNKRQQGTYNTTGE